MAGRRTFGNVRTLGSGRWQASYWLRGRRHTAPHTFGAKADANAFLAMVEADVRRGGWIDPAGGRLTVEGLAQRWMSHNPAKRSNSRARDEAIVRLHIVPAMGHTQIRDVSPPDLQGLVNRWAAVQAPRAVVRQYAVVRAMFTYAVAADWLARSPCRNVKLPEVEPATRRHLAPDDVMVLADAVGQRYRAMVWAAALLGLRWGEAAGLTVGSLDLLGRTVTVRQQLGRDGKLSSPKSKAGRRPQSAPAALMDMLVAHLAAAGLAGADTGALVFVSPCGAPLDYSGWRRRVWLPAAERLERRFFGSDSPPAGAAQPGHVALRARSAHGAKADIDIR